MLLRGRRMSNGLIAFCDTPAARWSLNLTRPNLAGAQHPHEMQIFTVSMAGTVHQLTDASPGLFQPAWSPEGRRMAVVRVGTANGTKHPTHEVWILRVHVRLRSAERYPPSASNFGFVTRGFFPAWAPNGSTISFARLDHRGLVQLWAFDLDTRCERRCDPHSLTLTLTSNPLLP